MARRVHVDEVRMGRVMLDASEAHHLRDVLRATVGDAIEPFDDAGRIGQARLVSVDVNRVEADIFEVDDTNLNLFAPVIASAIPKGQRADWMIEKLSELGVGRFIPLAAARSVVVPEGKSKIERWRRIAMESAKQCHRAGVMEIGEVTTFGDAVAACVAEGGRGCVAMTELPGQSLVSECIKYNDARVRRWIFIGPEGGWDESERRAVEQANLTAITLGRTILRTETAAVAAAAILAAVGKPSDSQEHT